MNETAELVYKKTDDTELLLRIYYPKGHDLNRKRPAVVFYYGGRWEIGTIAQFEPHSRHLASKGYIAITPEYRIKSKHGTTPFECVEDAKDALYFVWQKSSELGIDPARIAVTGASAGGHLAACTVILKDEKYDGRQIYKIPKAMVLFNPVSDTSENGYGRESIGERYLEISPFHHIYKGLPPTLVYHGTGDKIVPFYNSAAFCAKMQEMGNECTLVTYSRRGHGFFNKGKTKNDTDYIDTLKRTESFLDEKL
jgi:acetyl esterase